MIVKPFSQRLKAAAETLVKVPSSKSLPPSSFIASVVKQRNSDNATIRTIQEFVARIPDVVARRKQYDIEPGSAKDPVTQMFRRANLSPSDWARYAWFDESIPYTRNLIATDDKTYTLLLLCWNAGQESPIHDHPCDGCWLQVLHGDVREVRYDKQLKMISDDTYQEGAVTFITDSYGYHKVGNPSNMPSVSLHLYAPPFQNCLCWRTEDPAEVCESECTNHSEYGVKV